MTAPLQRVEAQIENDANGVLRPNRAKKRPLAA
jgi:hypothetical protein